MIASCPACGGTTLRPITPGFYLCESPIDASIPPGGGNPDWIHGVRPCGHRFQLAVNDMSPQCSCGRQSIGRCQDCSKPLCGLHGTSGGDFLCSQCLKERRAEAIAKMKREQETALAAAETAERRLMHKRASAASQLGSAASIAEIIGTLRARKDVLDKGTCRKAWRKLVAAEAVEPSHDAVSVVGWGHFLICGWQNDPGWLWHKTGSRSALWRGKLEREPAYIDADGQVFRPTASLKLDIPKGPTFWRGRPVTVALSRGGRFRAAWCPQSLGLVLLPNAKPRSPVDGSPLVKIDSHDSAYSELVTSILQ